MPFQTKSGSFERSRINVVSAVENVPSVRERLERFAVATTKVSPDDRTYRLLASSSLFRAAQPQVVFAVDGSNLEADVVSAYPGAKVVYITVASIIYQMPLHRALVARAEFLPHERDGLSIAQCSPFTLPLNNVVMDDCADPRESFRKAVYETLAETRPFQSEGGGAESLLETYEHLLSLKMAADEGSERKQPRCAVSGCQNRYEAHLGLELCPCDRGQDWYSTDRLGFWEEFGEEAVSGSAYGEFRQVAELLHFVNLMRMLFDTGCGAGHQSTADSLLVMIDGPLAVFRHPSWLSRPIAKELDRLNDALVLRGSPPLAIVGVEKTGAFVEHFTWLDSNACGEVGEDATKRSTRFPDQTLVLFDDDYIYSRITPRSESGRIRRPYGDETYFGRKAFYKNALGQRFVITVWLPEGSSLASFPRMGDITDILDEVGATRYDNALVPLMEAHSEASLPRNLGSRILSIHAIRAMGLSAEGGARAQ